MTTMAYSKYRRRMMLCSYCGRQFEDGEIFCPYCGTPAEDVTESQQNAPQQSAPAAQELPDKTTDTDTGLIRDQSVSLFCTKCGAKLQQGSAFCAKCGTKILYGSVQQAQPVHMPPQQAQPVHIPQQQIQQTQPIRIAQQQVQQTQPVRIAQQQVQQTQPVHIPQQQIQQTDMPQQKQNLWFRWEDEEGAVYCEDCGAKILQTGKKKADTLCYRCRQKRKGTGYF